MTRFLFAVAGLALGMAAGLAQTPVGGDPNQAYAITPAAGPWTICVSSFTGDAAAKLAHDLVVELRTKYRLQAYLFNHGAEERRQQEQDLQERRRQQEEALRRAGLNPADVPVRKKTVRVEEQYAVLVGGYKDMESASSDLKRIKGLPAPQSVPGGAIFTQDMAALVAGQKPKAEEVKLNPFRTSFVTPNPTIPMAAANANKADPFLKVLNADEPYSLLKCKHPLTLAIKEFYGATVLQTSNITPSGFMEKIFSSRPGAQLNAGAMNAHNMAEALRNPKIGLEAYVLHTRTASIVTVGGFDGPKDPHIEQVIQALGRSLHIDTKNPQFDQSMAMLSQPRLMEVPRP
jgi:hypothetical protein